MKGRAVKLREAHKSGSPAFCSAVWGPGGNHVVTASAADTAVLIHDATAVSGGGGGRGSISVPVATIRLHKDGVTSLAVAPGSGGSLASGSIDHSVKFYSFPGSWSPPPLMLDLIEFFLFSLRCNICKLASDFSMQRGSSRAMSPDLPSRSGRSPSTRKGPWWRPLAMTTASS